MASHFQLPKVDNGETLKAFWEWSGDRYGIVRWRHFNERFADNTLVVKTATVRSDGKILDGPHDDDTPIGTDADDLSPPRASVWCYPSYFFGQQQCYLWGSAYTNILSERVKFPPEPVVKGDTTQYDAVRECTGCSRVGEMYSFMKWHHRTS